MHIYIYIHICIHIYIYIYYVIYYVSYINTAEVRVRRPGVLLGRSKGN